MYSGTLLCFARFIAIRKMIGIAIKDMVQKFSAANAGFKLASHGIHLASPVVSEAISAFNNVPKEPTITKGMNTVNAFLILDRYLLSSTFSATTIRPS